MEGDFEMGDSGMGICLAQEGVGSVEASTMSYSLYQARQLHIRLLSWWRSEYLLHKANWGINREKYFLFPRKPPTGSQLMLDIA